jgi:hypothetical protein
MPPISFRPVGTPPISDGVLWGNFAVMLIGEVGTSALVHASPHTTSATCMDPNRASAYVLRSSIVTYPPHYCAKAILSDALVTHLSRSSWMQGVKVDLPVRVAQSPDSAQRLLEQPPFTHQPSPKTASLHGRRRTRWPPSRCLQCWRLHPGLC